MKSFIFKFLFVALFLSVTISSVSAKTYPDLPKNHWAYKQISALTDENVLVGYPDGTFMPDESATKAEFATMVIKALRQENAPLTETFSFEDVPYSHWAFNIIQRAIGFDLIKNSSDGLFKPEDTITKAEAMSIMVAALNINELGMEKAKQSIGVYANPDKSISRAEIASSLYNMQIEARINPNEKLSEAMKAKKGDGIVIKGVKIDGTVATIPKGTKIPVVLLNSLTTQMNAAGEVFLAQADKNLITTENYILIAQGSNIDGEITSVKPARLFVRNGKLGLDTKTITTTRNQTALFLGNIDAKTSQNWFVRIVRAIIKGGKIKLEEGKIVKIKLEQPVKIDLTNGWIIEEPKL
ncbi:MAG TPA: S-layer homology domain-containing protein [Candidatus Gastranaerophilales bacterium]|nr:S-layer homology domain-containing protein [Candidatus Gastranaerophilales bacterium]